MLEVAPRLALCAAISAAGPVLAFDEVIEVPTRRLTDEEVLRGDASGAPAVSVPGRLSGPDARGPVPVVIRLQEDVGPETARIVGHPACHPACTFELARETEVGAAPIRVFAGALDDRTPVAPCRDGVRTSRRRARTPR